MNIHSETSMSLHLVNGHLRIFEEMCVECGTYIPDSNVAAAFRK